MIELVVLWTFIVLVMLVTLEVGGIGAMAASGIVAVIVTHLTTRSHKTR